MRAQIGRVLTYCFVVGLPIHAAVVAFGVPSEWKDAILLMAFLVSLAVPPTTRQSYGTLLIAGYLALVLTSALIHPRTSIQDILPYLVYPLLAISIPRLFSTSRQLRTLLRWSSLGILINAFYFIGAHYRAWTLPSFILHQTGGSTRVGSLIGENLATATLFGVGAGIAWTIAAGRTGRVRWEVAIALVLTWAAILTGSRGALTAAAFGLVTASWVRVRRSRSGSPARVGLYYVGLWITVAMLLILSTYVHAGNNTLRAQRWKATIALAIHNPLVGAGPGATSAPRAIAVLGLQAYSAKGYFPDALFGTRVSESSPLKVLAEVGLPAFVLLCVWTAMLIKRTGILRRERANDLAMIFGVSMFFAVLGNGTTYQSMESFIGASFYWIAIGLCRIAAFSSDETGGEPFLRPSRYGHMHTLAVDGRRVRY